jgi:hypothetical protein
MLVDSTRRKCVIRWQKRAAASEHGFESRWGQILVIVHALFRVWSGIITCGIARR